MSVTFGAFTPPTYSSILQSIAQANSISGNTFYLDPKNGQDINDGLSPATAVATLAQAYALLVSGNNDTIYLIGDGTTAATARVNTAFVWAKNATRLIGVCAPTVLSQRARIAPSSTTTAFTPYFTISGNGCVFANISIFDGFTTGMANQIAVLLTGGRNYFENCHLAGMADATSAASAGSRSLKIGLSGSGENVFVRCTIGLDTIARSAANASVELTGGTPRNVFVSCYFPFFTSSATVLGILGTGAACVDRWTDFFQCLFANGIKSTSTQMTALISLTNAAPGGLISMRYSTAIGITKWGDTIGLANTYVDGGTPTAATTGLGINPS